MTETLLGAHSEFPQQYDPGILTSIPRSHFRDEYGITGKQGRLPFYGADIWNAYELSWLDGKGKPRVATGRIIFPCEAPNLVESKSLKLYLGSMNQEAFENMEQVTATMAKDLSQAAGDQVEVYLYALDDIRRYMPEFPGGHCLDELDVAVDAYHPAPEHLVQDESGRLVDEVVFTDLFRAICPVTGQPDWATVTTCYRGKQISHEGLLRYLVSFRQHGDFHENCVERVFMDITRRCKPRALTVEANFLRRGGLDINPVRSTVNIHTYKDFPRFPRQ